ncbi:MAG: twin-arginine translocation pathway signal protein [Bacteroidetes bacterium]|nr:twin-arginine translocation pathway signal protein [Bacteroidota bacterium]
MPDSRRAFVTKLLTLIAAIPILGVAACGDNRRLKKCTTSDDILGPFYRENAPSRTDLNANNQKGTELKINGTIYGEDCETPLNNAKVEIWHADDSGEYDTSTDDFEFRGIVHSDTDGKYEFLTIVPGRYLNGGTYRPGHIHFKITANGHEELVTQLYFQGDPFLDSDPWASDKDAEERIIILNEDASGNKSGTFDIKMMPA